MSYPDRLSRLRAQAQNGYANPSQMLNLIDQVTRLERENQELREALALSRELEGWK